MFAATISDPTGFLYDTRHCPAEGCPGPDCRPATCNMVECPLLKRLGKTKAYEPGDIVFWEGDEADRYYLVISGVLRGCKLLSDGRRQISRFVFPGDLMAYSGTEAFPYSAEAVTPVTVLAIPRPGFDTTTEENACLQRLVTKSLLDELRDTQDQVLLLGRMTAAERVSHFLAALARRTPAPGGADGVVELPMSRADIADFLGLTIETVSRVLSRFKRDGKISMIGHNRIVLNELAALADSSGELAA